MIKPINISPLNTSKELQYECEKCGDKGTMCLTNRIINTDNEGSPLEELDEICQKCNVKL
jgi:predicted SprT family Zn-dependent metalloprotease